MKYQECNKPKKISEGQLRVWHIPQVPGKPFQIYVFSIKEAKSVLNILAIYDLFQLENNIKPDYSNAQGLEVFDGKEWSDWYSDIDGGDIRSTEED